MSHSHSHSHNHKNINYGKAFAWGIALNIIYIFVEAIYGFIINSMSLIADAGHNLSDVLGLLLAWGAAVLARKLPTAKRTYGFRKSTILAALFNAIILLIAVGAILIESLRRFVKPEPVVGDTMILVAGIGVIINTLTALLFLKGRKEDLNIKGAFLHMTADAGISLGVVITGIIIASTNFYILDPIISVIIVLIIVAGTWSLLRDSFNLSMDAVPEKINVDSVMGYLENLPGVSEVHDLHIWAMSTTETALTVHLVIPEDQKDDKFLGKICGHLHKRFGIEHATIQIEKNAQSASCATENV